MENQLHLVTTMISRKGNNYLTFNGRQNMRNEIIRGVPLSEISSKFNVSYRTVLREKENIRLGTELPTGIGKERKKVQNFITMSWNRTCQRALTHLGCSVFRFWMPIFKYSQEIELEHWLKTGNSNRN